VIALSPRLGGETCPGAKLVTSCGARTTGHSQRKAGCQKSHQPWAILLIMRLPPRTSVRWRVTRQEAGRPGGVAHQCPGAMTLFVQLPRDGAAAVACRSSDQIHVRSFRGGGGLAGHFAVAVGEGAGRAAGRADGVGDDGVGAVITGRLASTPGGAGPRPLWRRPGSRRPEDRRPATAAPAGWRRR